MLALSRCGQAAAAAAIVLAVIPVTWGQTERNRDNYLNEDGLIPEGAIGRYDTEFRMHRDPRYLVLASRIVRPGTVYRVLAVLLDQQGNSLRDNLQYPLDVRASVSRDGVELASAKKTMSKGDIQMLLMKIPGTSTPGGYRLRVEGDHHGSLGGTVFVNETQLTFSPRFLTILIQTSRPMYSFAQMFRFRIVMLRTDLKPFDDPIDVYVLDSDGYIMRRWPSESSNNGVVALKFRLPGIGKGGWWRIRVNVRGQVEEKRVLLTKYFVPQWEVFVWTPTYFLLSDPAVTGDVSAGYTNDKVVTGRAKLELWARTGSPVSEQEREFKFITSYLIEQFTGGESFSFPMSSLRGALPRINEAEVKVIARVTEYWLNETYIGSCNSKLINSSISIKFLGSSPQLYKPGMPFKGQVLVTYHDSAPLSRETLESSSLVIRNTGGAGGGEIRIPSVQESRGRFTWLNSSFWDEAGRSVDPSDRSRDWDRDRDRERYLTDSETRAGLYFTEERLAAEKMQQYLMEQEWAEYRSTGVYRFEIETPPRGASIELTASFQGTGSSATTSLRLEPYFSVERRFLAVETSNTKTDVGQYAIFHVRSNFPLSYFYLIVLSKNLVIHGDRVPVEDDTGPTVKTVSLPVSAEMAPSFRLLVYHVAPDGEVVTDAIQVPVESINRGRTEIVLNQHKDHSKNTVELGVWSTPGATFCTTSNRAYLYSVQAGNDLTRTSVLSSLHSFENTTREIHHALWRWRDGSQPMRSAYYVTQNYGIDANATFDLAGLVVFTDARVESIPGSECFEGQLRCLTRGCYNASKACDGFDDCPDRSDEAECYSAMDHEEKERVFRLRRRSVFKDLFDQGDGDWAWLLQTIGYMGGEQRALGVPETNDDWYINGFSISQKDGFGLIEQPLKYTSNRPFYMTMEVASPIRRGETISARLLLVNNQDIEVLALVVLKDSPDYKFVHVEANGVISHRNVRTSTGDHQHLVPVAAGDSVEVAIPIMPTIDLGNMDVTVHCITQFGLDEESATVTVTAEGVQIGKHTSFLLDLKNRAVDHKFLNIFTEQSPEVPYAQWRRYVYGSPQGSVSVSGDVIGPVFPNVPMSTVSVFGRWLKSLDGTVFNLAYNSWSLHYLRLTNQLSRPFLRRVLEAMNVQFLLIMKRYRRGPFLLWDGGRPSVWTTAWAARQLQYSQFQDWENYLYVEPRILSESAEWMCRFQNEDGSFNETDYYRIPPDQKMDPRSKVPGDGYRKRRIPLTAHVLITLDAVQDKMQGRAKSIVATAKIRAVQYLERSLNLLTDPYEIAITAYALTVSKSVDREVAFSKLHQTRREVENMYYWAREPIDTNPVSKDVNQRPYLEAKNEQVWDAQAVEATSYALLVYLLRDGVGIDQEKMVLWLNSMRMFNAGWISTVDTILALQALTEYSYRARLRDITDLSVRLESSGLREFQKVVRITSNDTARIQTVSLPNVWGHVNVVGSGAGQAVVQLDVTFGIDREHLKDTPPRKAFNLEVKENMLQQARNKSIIHVNACVQWVNTNESLSSGAAILEVEYPSGYRLDQQVANANVRQFKRDPSLTLMNAKTAPDRIFWFFDTIHSNYTQCFNWTIYRRYLVANYTAYRSARLYEYFAPERFEMQIINSTELNVIDVCQVCGSYQCPYCPWYSGGVTPSPLAVLTLLLAALITASSRAGGP